MRLKRLVITLAVLTGAVVGAWGIEHYIKTTRGEYQNLVITDGLPPNEIQSLHNVVKVPSEFFEPSPTPSPTFSVYGKAADDFNASHYVTYPISKSKCIGTFVPPSIAQVQKVYSRGTINASSLIMNDLNAMMKAAASAGIDLKVVSGYRSYNDQVFLFESYVKNEMTFNPGITRAQAEVRANYYSARPGCSEHQLGTAVDVLSSESNYTFNVNDSMKFVQWVKNNSIKYNFRISYPPGNSEYKYEPWHLRWYP